MEVSGQLHTAAASPSGKEPPVSNCYEDGCTPEGGEEKKIPAGKRTPAIQPITLTIVGGNTNMSEVLRNVGILSRHYTVS
jgi:hypothetical protein